MAQSTAPRLDPTLAWTGASLLLAVGLHATRLPAWLLFGFAILIGWRALLALRRAPLPSRLVRTGVLLGLVLAVWFGFRTLNGLAAGTALLSLMAGLKLLETGTPRDHVVVLLICYFLVLAAFLHDQTLLLLPLHAASLWLTTTALLKATQGPADIGSRAAARLTGRMLVQATPLMIALFVLFPRVPGPFWALPDAGRASSGLDEEMSPGGISDLSLRSDPAFRVRFEGPVPPPAERYWRGPVLHDFDGYTWRRLPGRYLPAPELEFAGPAYDYTLMLEPGERNWVFALDMPEIWVRSQIGQRFDYQLVARDSSSSQRFGGAHAARIYQLRSRPQWRPVQADMLSESLRRIDTRLPRDRNPRTQRFAQQLFQQSGRDPAAFVSAALRHFREGGFEYTLTPPRLDFDSVDDFLFNTRRGFCGHFASAFTTLMRAAGVPARVVTGYQGGELNRWAGYYLVRQSDAHAWSEVWLQGRGWVRVDPTAVVSPARIERGLADAMGENAPVADRLIRDNPWLAEIRFAWDALNTSWREYVLEFSASSQAALLERLGLSERGWEALSVLLLAALIASLVVLLYFLTRELRGRQRDPVLAAYATFCRRLERCGLRRLPHEGPLDFARRVAQQRPELAESAARITGLYRALRYEPGPREGARFELERQVRAFRPARAH